MLVQLQEARKLIQLFLSVNGSGFQFEILVKICGF